MSILSAERSTKQANSELPDVYYILLDEYGRDDVLKQVYNFDNSSFSKTLEQKGFYIARESHSNYGRTLFSLASLLSMEYINYLGDQEGHDSRNYAPLISKIRNNRVLAVFKDLGYTTIHIDSANPPTDTSDQADFVISAKSVSEFKLILIDFTMLKAFFEQNEIRRWQFHYHYSFEKIANVAKNDQPTYVFAHIMLPHPPFVFTQDGGIPEDYQLKMKMDRFLPPDDKYHQLYQNQLVYTNNLVLKLVDQILTNSKSKPIIIIQSDHGSWPKIPWENNHSFVSERFAIFNAFHLPKEGKKKLYPSISSVNTFRLIFDYYFKIPVPLLPDKHYYSHPYDSPYLFSDITDVLAKKQLGEN